jgi:hypothetical protein
VRNQYFGDINDYRKYGLIRALTNHGELRTTVCWMLTPDDGKEKPEIGTDPLKQTDPTIRLQL